MQSHLGTALIVLIFGMAVLATNAQLTKDMVDSSQMPMQTKGDCSSTVTDKTSNGMK